MGLLPIPPKCVAIVCVFMMIYESVDGIQSVKQPLDRRMRSAAGYHLKEQSLTYNDECSDDCS